MKAFFFLFTKALKNFDITVDGSLLQKASRQMLQASSQASCMPPSTKAAAEVGWLSIFFISSISAKPTTKINKSNHLFAGMKRSGNRCCPRTQSSYRRQMQYPKKHIKATPFHEIKQGTTSKI